MAALFDDPFPSRFHAATSRFALAIAASAGGHLYLAALLALEPPRRVSTPPAITVHLEPRVAAVQPEPVVATGGPLFAAARAEPRAVRSASRETPQRKSGSTLALPQAPDPTYYAARDLDVYPRLLAPLDLGALAVDAAARFRVSLMIDETGAVNEVAAAGAAPEGLPEALRAALAGTRFVPGQKDGRAVKSRLLLDISLGPEQREP